MHLIFIRHGDPDYSIDSVTEKGKCEIELLGKRISKLNATEFFVSPMGRAQATAKACLENIHADILYFSESFPESVQMHHFVFFFLQHLDMFYRSY